MTDRSARKLEHEVNAIINAAIKGGGVGAHVKLHFREQHKRRFRVDHLEIDRDGDLAEVWLSSYRKMSFFDRLRRIRIRDFLRVSRVGGDVRLGVHKVMVRPRQEPETLRYREEIGAPRLSRAVATFRQPRPDAYTWLNQAI